MHDDVLSYIALTLGIGWASGVNLYAAIGTLGLLHRFGIVDLPDSIQYVASPLVLTVALTLYAVGFVADKIPYVDSVWDAIHTFIRIPAGAVLAADMVTDVDPALSLSAFLIGGAFAANGHFAKAGTRLIVNASPEPMSNSVASLIEDAMVIGGMVLAVTHPAVFVAALAVALVIGVWLITRAVRLYRALRASLRTRAARVLALFGSVRPPAAGGRR